MSCFTTERKHRDTKRCAKHVFGSSFETTVNCDIVNRAVRHYVDRQSDFQEICMVVPRAVGQLFRSIEAVMACGTAHVRDIVYLTDCSVASVIDFWQASLDDEVHVRLDTFSMVGGSPTHPSMIWDTSAPTVAVKPARQIAEALCWRSPAQGRIHVVLPL